MQKKKVCFFLNTLAVPGGTQRVLTTIVNQLVNNYTVSIIVTESLETVFDLDDRVQLVMIPSVKNSFFLWKRSFFVYNYLKKKSIHYFVVLDANISLIYNCFVPSKCQAIIWEHLSLKNNRTTFFCRLSRWMATKYVDKFVFLNDLEIKLWRDKYALSERKIVKIYNPLSFNNIPKVDPQGLFSKKKMLAVGNAIHVKGFDLLLESWRILNAKGWVLQIVGLTEERAKDLMVLITEFELEKSVELIPPVSNIEYYYLNASIYCLSSRSEVLPMVLIEAQAYGLPAVCFPCGGGPKEILNQSGIICNSYSVNEYAMALRSLIESSAAFVKFSNAAQISSKEFEISKIIKEWERVFS
ncbi:MAG: glycosyltransferase [Flavobacteriaceae bacterium]|nr:glycosyltransferase [Flavobacteriaceae bacterium]